MIFNKKTLRRPLRIFNLRFCAVFIAVQALVAAFAPPARGYTGYESPFGINAHIFNESEAQAMEAMGVKWTRTDFNWSWIESAGKGVYDWLRWDAMVEAAHNHDLYILAVVGYCPHWASSRPEEDSDHYLPADNKDYKDFLRAVVERYDGDGVDDMPGSYIVHAWELWNEPDIGFCNCAPEEYAAALTAGYEGVMEADPDAVVAMGGLSRGGIDGDFTDRMLDAITAATATLPFHIINNHNYHGIDALIPRTQRHRLSFTSRGFNLPYWYTEGSIQAGSPSEEAEQAAGVIKSYTLSLSIGVEKFFWYMWQSTINDFSEGFFYGNGTRKMGYYAYRTMAELVSPRYYDPALQVVTGEFEQYGFSDPGGATGKLYVLWSRDNEPHDVQLYYPATALDYITATGTVTRIGPGAGGFYKLTVDELPFYLREAGADPGGPALREPSPNRIISDKLPDFKWDEFAGAESYILRISADVAFPPGNTRQYAGITGATYSVGNPLGDGEWYTKVTAVASGGELFTGPVSVFTVDTVPPPTPEVDSISHSLLAYNGSAYIDFGYNTDPDIVGINIYRSDRLAGLGDAVYSTVAGDTGGFADRFGSELKNLVYYYRVTSIDAAEPPNESQPSETYMVFYKVPAPLDSGWNLLSFPGYPSDSVSYNPDVPSEQGLVLKPGGFEWDNRQGSSLDPTRVYWIFNESLTPGEMVFSGPIRNPPAVREFSLAAGWNAVPNPYPMPLAWIDGDTGPSFSLSEESPEAPLSLAVSNNWIRGDVYYYQAGAYVRVAQNQSGHIPPFHSFWIKTLQPCTLTIKAP